jgi:hypothetical protein
MSHSLSFFLMSLLTINPINYIILQANSPTYCASVNLKLTPKLVFEVLNDPT